MNARALPLLVACGLVCAAGWRLLPPRAPATPGGKARAAIPAGVVTLVTADLRALGAASLDGPVRAAATAAIDPDLGAHCAGDPLAPATDLALAVPASFTQGPVALAAEGAFATGPIVACASRVIAAWGGEPRAADEGGFVVVRDAGDGAPLAFAIREGGPLLVAAPGYLASMREVSSGARAAVDDDAAFAAMRHEVGESSPFVIVVALTADERERLAFDLGESAARGVVALAASIDLGPTSTHARAGAAWLHAVAGCVDPAGCDDLARSVERLVAADDPRDLAASWLGVALAPRANVTRQGATARAEAALTSPEIVSVLAHLAAATAP